MDKNASHLNFFTRFSDISQLLLLPNQTWVHLPWHSKTTLVMHRIVERENTVFVAGHHTRSSGQLVLRKPECPEGFQQRSFKGEVREVAGHVISLCTALCLVEGELTGQCQWVSNIGPQAPAGLGVVCSRSLRS